MFRCCVVARTQCREQEQKERKSAWGVPPHRRPVVGNHCGCHYYLPPPAAGAVPSSSSSPQFEHATYVCGARVLLRGIGWRLARLCTLRRVGHEVPPGLLPLVPRKFEGAIRYWPPKHPEMFTASLFGTARPGRRHSLGCHQEFREMMAAMALLLTLAAFLGVAEAGLFDSPLFSSGMILQRGASAASTLSRGVSCAAGCIARSSCLVRRAPWHCRLTFSSPHPTCPLLRSRTRNGHAHVGRQRHGSRDCHCRRGQGHLTLSRPRRILDGHAAKPRRRADDHRRRHGWQNDPDPDRRGDWRCDPLRR